MWSLTVSVSMFAGSHGLDHGGSILAGQKTHVFGRIHRHKGKMALTIEMQAPPQFFASGEVRRLRGISGSAPHGQPHACLSGSAVERRALKEHILGCVLIGIVPDRPNRPAAIDGWSGSSQGSVPTVTGQSSANAIRFL